MGLFKFQNYGAIANLKTAPGTKATKITKNGYVFKVVDNFTTASDGVYAQAGIPLTDDAEAKKARLYVAMNIIDKPETLNDSDFQLNPGEPLRAACLNEQMGEPLEISSDLCTTAYATVNVGDILIPIPAGTNEMLWKVASGTDIGYGACLKVVKKTMFGSFTVDGAGGGYTCKVISN